MGVYDTVEVGGREGQVKCWSCSFHTIHWGDHVGSLHGFSDYSVAMREGGYLHIQGGGLVGWKDEPLERSGTITPPIFDKYGRVFNEETQGELAEVVPDPYFF